MYCGTFSVVHSLDMVIGQLCGGKSQKTREKEKVLKMTKNSGKNGHKSETSHPNELKFR